MSNTSSLFTPTKQLQLIIVVVRASLHFLHCRYANVLPALNESMAELMQHFSVNCGAMQ